MLRLLQTLLHHLHRSWSSMGRSNFLGMLSVLIAAYAVLSAELLLEILRSWLQRRVDMHDPVRQIQSWQPALRTHPRPVPVAVPARNVRMTTWERWR